MHVFAFNSLLVVVSGESRVHVSTHDSFNIDMNFLVERNKNIAAICFLEYLGFDSSNFTAIGTKLNIFCVSNETSVKKMITNDEL